MKKSVFKALVKECLVEILKEAKLLNEMMNSNIQDNINEGSAPQNRTNKKTMTYQDLKKMQKQGAQKRPQQRKNYTTGNPMLDDIMQSAHSLKDDDILGESFDAGNQNYNPDIKVETYENIDYSAFLEDEGKKRNVPFGPRRGL